MGYISCCAALWLCCAVLCCAVLFCGVVPHHLPTPSLSAVIAGVAMTQFMLDRLCFDEHCSPSL